MKKPPFTRCFEDRHGKWRCYLRKPGCKPVALPGLPWTPEFMAAYEAALQGKLPPKRAALAHGTVADVVEHYYATKFQTHRATTQAAYRCILEKIVKAHGHRDIALLTTDKLEEMLYAKTKTPHAANRWLKIWRTLCTLAVKMKLRTDNPTTGIKFLPVTGDGHLAWTEELVAQYRAQHATGTKARLAFELLVCTMQRRGDVVKLGRQHLKDGWLAFRQSKTGMQVEIPVLPELQAELAVLPAGQMTFLMTEQGKPFTAAGFGGWFNDRRKAAGIPPGYSGTKASATLADARSGQASRGSWNTSKPSATAARTANGTWPPL
jgi:integrase